MRPPSNGHRAGVGSLTQTSLHLAYRGLQAVTGHGGAFIGDSRVVAFSLLPRVTAGEETLLIVVTLISKQVISCVFHHRSSLSQRARSQFMWEPDTSRNYAVHAMQMMVNKTRRRPFRPYIRPVWAYRLPKLIFV